MATSTFDPLAWPRPLLRLRTLCAVEEVAATMRHQALNELTAVGALVYRIRSRVLGAARAGGQQAPAEIGPLFDAVEARLQGASARLGFCCLPPAAAGALTDLGREARSLLGALGVRAEVRAPAAAAARIAADELEVAFGCVVENAVEALAQAGSHGQLEVVIEQRGAQAALEVRDEGVGVPDGVFEHLYDPFFTTHPGRAGLGLKIARRIAHRWGGELALARREPRGFRASLLLPAG